MSLILHVVMDVWSGTRVWPLIAACVTSIQLLYASDSTNSTALSIMYHALIVWYVLHTYLRMHRLSLTLYRQGKQGMQ
jgi:hypothetical protein